MRIVGGGAKNPVWRQIFADIFGMPIIETNVSDEAGSLGRQEQNAISARPRLNYQLINKIMYRLLCKLRPANLWFT